MIVNKLVTRKFLANGWKRCEEVILRNLLIARANEVYKKLDETGEVIDSDVNELNELIKNSESNIEHLNVVINEFDNNSNETDIKGIIIAILEFIILMILFTK